MHFRTLLISTLLLLCFGVGLGYLMLQDPGYVLLAYKQHTLETSIWVFMLVSVLVFIPLFVGLYLLVRLFTRVQASKVQFKDWNRDRLNRRARLLTNKGLVEYELGNYSSAQKLLARSAEKTDTAMINYLVSARAANEIGNHNQADDLLKKAMYLPATDELAVGLTQARIQLSRDENEKCLATLMRLKKRAPHHEQLLKLLKETYVKLQDWEQLADLLPELEKYKVINEQEVTLLAEDVYLALLAKAKAATRRIDLSESGITKLETTWSRLPAKLQRNSKIVYAYAEHLVALGADDKAEVLLRTSISRNWDEDLVRLYGLVEGRDAVKHLLVAEGWIKERPNSSVLMLTLGRLALRNHEWQKAREYLEASVKLHKDIDAYGELCRLLASQGDAQQCLTYFQKGLVGELPALPMPADNKTSDSEDLKQSSSGVETGPVNDNNAIRVVK